MTNCLILYSRKAGEVGMTYKRGRVFISVQRVDGHGKNPGLWIGTDDPNQMEKVASFGNYEKAKLFCKWLDCMFGLTEERSVTWE